MHQWRRHSWIVSCHLVRSSSYTEVSNPIRLDQAFPLCINVLVLERYTQLKKKKKHHQIRKSKWLLR